MHENTRGKRKTSHSRTANDMDQYKGDGLLYVGLKRISFNDQRIRDGQITHSNFPHEESTGKEFKTLDVYWPLNSLHIRFIRLHGWVSFKRKNAKWVNKITWKLFDLKPKLRSQTWACAKQTCVLQRRNQNRICCFYRRNDGFIGVALLFWQKESFQVC